jgi:hypothetical protein
VLTCSRCVSCMPSCTCTHTRTVLMAMGSIFWEQGVYSALEALFRQSAEFCSEHDVWKLNVAHTFFMQARAGLWAVCLWAARCCRQLPWSPAVELPRSHCPRRADPLVSAGE